MQLVPKRTFLLRQDELSGGKKKDVIAHKGVKIEVTEKEAIKFWGAFDLSESDQKKLLTMAKNQKLTRVV